MRIAVISSAFPVLSQTFVLNQITAFIDAGHDVTIIADHPKEHGNEDTPVHQSVDAYGLRERTLYWGFVENPPLAERLEEKTDLLKSTDYAQIVRGLWAGREALGIGQGPSTWRRVKRAAHLSTVKPFDAIIAHFGTVGLECQALREMGALKGPLITVFHGYDMSLYLREKGFDVYDELLKNGELFLPISGFWKRRLLRMGAEEERTIVHHMGIDPARFTYEPRTPSDDGEVRILSIGRFVEKKGFADGIKAFALIAEEFPKARYTIVGDGDLRPELEALIEELGVAEGVELTGWADREEVLQALQEHHILMVPSLTAADGDMEGIPVVLMEGMATGIAVVSTRHSGIPELVEHERSGLLADEGDVEGLADALRRLVGDPRGWEEFGRQGRATVEEHFSVRELNRRLIEMIGTRFGTSVNAF